MENNNKTQAELYREERKERLAKAAAKKAKKSPAVEKTKKTLTKVIAIVLAVVIGLGAIFATLNFFGIPQKALKVTVDNTDYKFSLAEYNFYYYSLVMNYTSTAYQYDSHYGEGSGITYLGYDYKKAPDKQEYTDELSSMAGYTLEDLGNPEDPTWADVFRVSAVNQIIQVKFASSKAKEMGLKLTEEEEKDIDEQIDSLRTTAKNNDFSLDRYLRSQYGNGITEKLLKQMYVEQTLATNYFTTIQEDTLEAITDEQVNTRYNENKDDYDIASARIYAFEFEADVADDATEEEKKAAEEKAKKEAKSKADAFIAEVTDETSFLKQAELTLKLEGKDKDDDSDSEDKTDLSTKADKNTKAEDMTFADFDSVCGDISNWIFDDTRKAGDKEVVYCDDGAYYAVLMLEPAHKDTTIVSNDVRHILIKFPEKNTDGTATTTKDEDGNTKTNITKETKAETKAEAQKILDEYLKNPTEENFIALTKKHTDDVDSEGNPNNGGLYEDVADNGQYVAAFTKWAVDAKRKPGDTGIVETEYGYHIMYYVSAGNQTWFETVKNEIYNENYTAATDALLEEYYKAVNNDSFIINWATKDQNELISTMIAYNFS